MIPHESVFDLHTMDLVLRLEDLPPDLTAGADLDWLIGERRINGGYRHARRATVTVALAGKHGLPLPIDPRGVQSADGDSLSIGRAPDGGWMMAINDCVMMRLDPAGDVRVEVLPFADRRAQTVGNAMVHALDHVLSCHGQCLVHGASLLTPDGAGMVILHATSGTGKTTTAMALALAGFRLSGDDTTALIAASGGGAPTAWGLPRWAKVHRETVRLLPALADLTNPSQLDRGGEQMIARGALSSAGLVTPAGPLPVVAVVSLTRNAGGVAMAKTQRPFDALRDLLEDNVSAGPAGFYPGHEARFGIFAAMVAGTRCLQVPVIGHPQAVAKTIADALGY